MNRYLLGLDLGTSGLKAAVLDGSGRMLASAGREYAIDSPRPGWAEQDPQVWYTAACAAVSQVLAESGVRGDEVQGVGLAGQMHSLVCVDENGAAVRPAILWADQRSAPQVKRLNEQIGREKLAASAGNPVAAGFAISSWLWLRENEPETVRRTRFLLQPKDMLRFMLTGVIGGEPSDASATLLFDPHTWTWSPVLLEAAGLSPDRLPPLHPSAEVCAGLTSAAARDLNLKAGTPVVYGGSDQAVQALGQGIIDVGQVSGTIGTGGQWFAPLAQPVHDPQLRLHLFCHVLPARWHLEAAILTAGLALRWLRDQVLTGGGYTELADAAAGVAAATDGLFFLPYLAGERTPHMDPLATAAFTGLTLRHGRAHLTRAVMEGVVFAMREGLDLLEGLGVHPEAVLACGGSNRHPLWLKLQANIYNRPIQPAASPEATARGAALLAGVGIGQFDSFSAAVQAVPAPHPAVLPDPAEVEKYDRAYPRFKQIYPALKKAE
ncbi:D-xylulose kinase [Longilinea arvoryzae]|uniref:Xylulose kinase n=1 Tax=Longilinea arvoryzae TaxID=360412 RepID=A0A0S7BJ46_9CHLR|nr:xylulokinase [Longilinea arvoryzae]GAP13889.1 D-xylulose kinase [Longilinea arvoryzae]